MQRLLIAALIAAILLFPGMACSQSGIDIKGWNKAEWGMAESDLLNIYKDTLIKSDKRQYLDGDELYTDMKIPGLKIDGATFDVFFEMGSKDNTLKRVRLTKYYSASALDFTQFEKLLTSKYGSPSYKEEEKQGKSVASWLLPYTKIDLEYIYSAYDGKVLDILYADRGFTSKNNDKL
ncbi:MAG TPA: hypothetical protein VHO70_07565 [Chitinispirillaceae bacterium]|nr:hypothetical protein [Chitinispirillaceae bacterium]